MEEIFQIHWRCSNSVKIHPENKILNKKMKNWQKIVNPEGLTCEN